MSFLKLTFFCLLIAISTISPAQGRQQNTAEVVYYGFDPDIVTNYVTDNRRALGYLRLSVELMLPNRDSMKTIEYHEPLILDTIIGILSKQPEQKVKSLTGREEIRQDILERLQQVLRRETGQPIILDVLFTKYMYQ